jgi:cytoskeletal protein CcmA (bactofilin family)
MAQPSNTHLPARLAGIPGARAPSVISAAQERSPEAMAGTLMVGAGIQIKAEVSACDVLHVDGKIESSGLKAKTLKVRKDGAFVGNAEIETAIVAGTFEGNLNVLSHLTIKPTGRVSGKIRYAKLTIEEGGQIAGDADILKNAKYQKERDQA